MKICSHFPSKSLSPQEIEGLCGTTVEFQKEKLGFFSRKILGEGENGLSLAQIACEKLFKKENIKSESIELLIYVTQTPEKQIPQNSSQLQFLLNLPYSVAAFDVNLGCSGYVYALSIAKGIMCTENLKNALIVTCDCYSGIINYKNKDTASIFGDAATATFIGDYGAIQFTTFGTDGSNSNKLCIGDDGYLFMDGRSIFNFMMKRIKPSIQACLAKNELELVDIDYFIFHQANKFLLTNLVRTLNLPEYKCLMHMSESANTVSSSIPLVIEEYLGNSTLQGKTVLLSGFGVGLSWATTIIKL